MFHQLVHTPIDKGVLRTSPYSERSMRLYLNRPKDEAKRSIISVSTQSEKLPKHIYSSSVSILGSILSQFFGMLTDVMSGRR